MAASSSKLVQAAEAHLGHVALPDGGHVTFCMVCGEQATISPGGDWSCEGGCQPGKAKAALVAWYEQVWLPEHQGSSNGTKTSKLSPTWPKYPPAEADLEQVRGYLTAVIDLPANYKVDRAVRFGPYLDDPVAFWIRREGVGKDINVRFERLSDLGKPAVFRAALAAATNGAARMRQPSVPQAGDFLMMICRLADLLEEATVADETQAWVDEYLDRTHLVSGHSLAIPDRRADALEALRAIPEFDRVQAGLFVRRELPREYWPAQLFDEVTHERWVRTGEFAAYLRHVHGTSIKQQNLDARLREIGIERTACEVNRPGFVHIRLLMYRVPPAAIDD